MFNRSQMFVLMVQTWLILNGQVKPTKEENRKWALKVIDSASCYIDVLLPKGDLTAMADAYCQWKAGYAGEPEWVKQTFAAELNVRPDSVSETVHTVQ